MSAPVYVGKHRDGLNVWAICSAHLDALAASILAGRKRFGISPRHAARDDGPPRGYINARHEAFRRAVLEAPVAATPSSAVAVKAGGVATLTGGDTTQPGLAELRERAYLAGSRVLYGTDYMRGEKERAYRLARKVIEASGLIEAVQTLRAAQR